MGTWDSTAGHKQQTTYRKPIEASSGGELELELELGVLDGWTGDQVEAWRGHDLTNNGGRRPGRDRLERPCQYAFSALKVEATVLWSSRLEIQGNRAFFNLFESSHEFR